MAVELIFGKMAFAFRRERKSNQTLLDSHNWEDYYGNSKIRGSAIQAATDAGVKTARSEIFEVARSGNGQRSGVLRRAPCIQIGALSSSASNKVCIWN